MTKIKVVLDMNVLASGLASFRNPASTVAALLRLWRLGAFALVTSEYILTELSNTLHRPYFRQRLTPQQINSAISLFRSEATITPLTIQVHGIATHPEDDVILATAVSAKADYAVSTLTTLDQPVALHLTRLVLSALTPGILPLVSLAQPSLVRQRADPGLLSQLATSFVWTSDFLWYSFALLLVVLLPYLPTRNRCPAQNV
jgi:putative PIN family toxin of toxin-antitoxin system